MIHGNAISKMQIGGNSSGQMTPLCTSMSGKMGQRSFPLFLLLGKTKIPGHCICNKHKKTLKGKEKADCTGTSGPEEQHDGEFPGFSLCLRDPRLGAKEAGVGYPKKPMGTEKKKQPQPKPALSIQRITKGSS